MNITININVIRGEEEKDYKEVETILFINRHKLDRMTASENIDLDTLFAMAELVMCNENFMYPIKGRSIEKLEGSYEIVKLNCITGNMLEAYNSCEYNSHIYRLRDRSYGVRRVPGKTTYEYCTSEYSGEKSLENGRYKIIDKNVKIDLYGSMYGRHVHTNDVLIKSLDTGREYYTSKRFLIMVK